MATERVTRVGALSRLNGGVKLRGTQAGALARIGKWQLRGTQAGALTRIGKLQVQATTVGVLVRVQYVEPEPSDNELDVTQVGALARLHLETAALATQVGALARIHGDGLRSTQAGALARLALLRLRATRVSVLVRITPVATVAAPVYIFGLRDVRLWREDAIVVLDAAQRLAIRERVKAGELSGNDHTLAIAAHADVLEWELEAGGMPLAAYGLMTGRAVAIAGDEPERTATLLGQALDDFPFFRIYGKSLGDEDDDLHVKIFYAKLSGEPKGLFGEGQFWTTQCNGVALAGPEGLYEVVHNVTAQELDLPT